MPWNAGFVEIGWATVEFTKGEVQQRQWTVVLDIPEGSALPLPKRLRAGRSRAISSVSTGFIRVIFCSIEER